MADSVRPYPGIDTSAYEARLTTEKNTYRDCLDVHNLPEIFHYWSNRYVRPKLEAFGFRSPEEMFLKFPCEQLRRNPAAASRVVSLGAGNCQMEISLALHLRSAGCAAFVIDCLELNPAMLERGRNAAAKEGVADLMNFLRTDLNEWEPAHEYDVAIANQTLHHVVNLERLFSHIKRSLRPQGRFVISDIIGRNGHQRWPEALAIVQEFWRKLPPSYRYNRQVGRYEERYGNWDCSGEGFEGIRAQDILPLLLDHFHFELFVAYANVIDAFVDRSFGSNFDPAAAWDRSFIDQVHQRDEVEILSGRISPTHMLAVVGNDPAVPLSFREPLKPQFCLRNPARAAGEEPICDAYEWGAWPHSAQSQLQFVCGQLTAFESMVKEAEAALADRTAWGRRLDRQVVELARKISELQEELNGRTLWVRRLERELQERTTWALQLEQENDRRIAWGRQLDQELQERTAWAARLDSENEKRLAWGQRLEQELQERTSWALQLEQENQKLAARAAALTNDLERLAWAQALDRRFHRLLDRVFRIARHAFGRARQGA